MQAASTNGLGGWKPEGATMIRVYCGIVWLHAFTRDVKALHSMFVCVRSLCGTLEPAVRLAECRRNNLKDA